MAAVRREPPEVAAWQGGVFTRDQALAEGWTDRQVRMLRERGDWVLMGGRVLAPRELPVQAEALAWAAALTWPGSVTSHLTAARLHRFPVADCQEGWVTGRAARRRAYRLRHRQGELNPDEVTTLDGLALTGPARTAVDCLTVLPVDEGFDLWAWLSSRRVLTRTQLAQAVGVRFGRDGNARLVRLLELTRTGAASHAERRLHALLRTAGLRGWRAGVPVHDGAGVIAVVDVLFEREKVAIEVDGWRSHSSRDAFAADRQRQNRLVNQGYRPLRFTWDDLVGRPHEVVAEITEALALARDQDRR